MHDVRLDIMIQKRNVIFAIVESSAWEEPTHRVTSGATNLSHQRQFRPVRSVAAAHL